MKDDFFGDDCDDEEVVEDRALAKNRESITSAILPFGGRPDDALDPREEREKLEREE